MSVRDRKIIVLGSRNVGKTTLLVQLTESHFVESYYPTIENQFIHEFVLKKPNGTELKFNLDIVDTSGQDEFSMINAKSMLGVAGCILMYSVANRHSFEILELIRDKMLDMLGLRELPIVLVGNKIDLERQVSYQEGEELAKRLKCGFVEICVKQGSGIEMPFKTLIQKIEGFEDGYSRSEEGGSEGCVVM
ncbi:GTP-binding protein rhb1 [Kluyveromyces marxianus]|uniref:GTP-binding protein rhb1 n=1 Tax=Kluyveromyces marxianus TaxID=4911 RepID=A0ABX6ERJ6_KLUMA|nr:GTP-binding protein rhb1 [Kluyveromyces marxianus]